MSKSSAHENGMDYYCIICGKVYLHDSNEAISIESYKELYQGSGRPSPTGGVSCSPDCEREFLSGNYRRPVESEIELERMIQQALQKIGGESGVKSEKKT